jgi:hypothetical protein
MRRHAAALWLIEKALLRQQLAVLSRQVKRPDLTSSDLCWLRRFPLVVLLRQSGEPADRPEHSGSL